MVERCAGAMGLGDHTMWGGRLTRDTRAYIYIYEYVSKEALKRALGLVQHDPNQLVQRAKILHLVKKLSKRKKERKQAYFKLISS